MKIIKQIFTLTAAMLLFTACNKNEELAPEINNTFPADGIIRVATTVTSPQTRSGMTTADLEKFQLRIVNGVNPDYSYDARMMKEGDEWVSFEIETDDYGNPIPLTMLWQNKTEKIKVNAVAGLSSWLDEPIWNCSITVNNVQDPEIEMKRSDILHMSEEVIDPSSNQIVNGKIPIIFKHRLSKLNLTVKMGTEFNKLVGGTDENLISNIKVRGTHLRADWTIMENTLSNYENVGDISPWDNTIDYIIGEGDIQQAEAKYECILIPQTVAADYFGVRFTIGDRDFIWYSPKEVVLAADTQYNLTLNVGHDVVTVDGFSATPWTEADEQNIGTE